MRGEFIGVWSETSREIWQPLIDSEDVSEDIFCELYRVLASALKEKISIEVLAEIIDNPAQSRGAFERTSANDLAGERELATFLEMTHSALDEFVGDKLSNCYFNLLARFIDKFSLRYDLRRPCTLCPTLTGVFASLVRDLRVLTSQDAHLDALMKDFEESLRDLRFGCTDGRIRSCVGKQFMLLEGIGAVAPGVTKGTLGGMCDELASWPHAAVKESLKKLYGFDSNYPGIRHGRNASGKLRDIDMRDLVAMSILLFGFAPYLEHRLSAADIFGGGVVNSHSIAQNALSTRSAASSSVMSAKWIKRLREVLARFVP